jgi:hypothetical protein
MFIRHEINQVFNKSVFIDMKSIKGGLKKTIQSISWHLLVHYCLAQKKKLLDVHDAGWNRGVRPHFSCLLLSISLQLLVKF